MSSIRLTTTSYVVLGLLEQCGPSSPYDLKGYLEQSVENFWPVPHTTFYAEPARLAAAGLLTEDQEPHGRRRKLYALTDAGREALRAWVREPDAAPPQVRDELMLKVFLGADPRPLAEARLAWHRRKEAELEGYLEAVRSGTSGLDGVAGVERSLVAGLAYNRAMIDMIERLGGRRP
jgi:DNA-binding PadR family transcriptional regulator